ncbi:MAG: RNA polymerase sigma-70 factor [Bacteroidales bacterium]|nr:RNA polymerase sigma-70 factor [Bacteroidales bacterium]MDD3988981.1 RNA polymerase sigma-70 factor [Bacteroidales bacterium]MDD4638789.1 RNA polymerase sigma-70 factor [Bacteroidales bacterium]
MENPGNIDMKTFIVSAIRHGNEKAFEYFYAAEYLNLKYFITRYIKEPNLAEDIVQDSFMVIWENREKIDPDLNLKSFLFTIARNKAINILRKKEFNLTDGLDISENKFMIDVLNDKYMISRIDALDMKRTISKTYNLLPEKIRETFILSRNDGLSYKEIADKLGISVKIVEHNISAALRIFRKKLGRYLLFIKIFVG